MAYGLKACSCHPLNNQIDKYRVLKDLKGILFQGGICTMGKPKVITINDSENF